VQFDIEIFIGDKRENLQKLKVCKFMKLHFSKSLI